MKKLILFSTSLCLLLKVTNIKSQCSVANSVSSASLIASYPFTNGNGNDVSGNNLNASFFGSSPTTNKVGVAGKAVNFTGGSSAGGTVAHNALMNMTNQITIAAWFNSNNIGLTQRIVDKINGSTTGNFLLDIYQSKLRFFVAPSSVQYGTALSSNVWYHVVATYDGSSAKIYLNGAQVAVSTFTGNMASNTNPLRIGEDQLGGNNFSGKFDDIKIYSRVLTNAEIMDLYQIPDFDVQPSANVGLCSNLMTITAHAVSTGSNVTYKWKKGSSYLTDNSTYSGTATNILAINNGGVAEYGKYELEAYSQNCIVAVSDTANVLAGSVSTFDNTGLILDYPFNNYSPYDFSGNNLHTIFVNGNAGSDQNGTPNGALNLASNAHAYTPNNSLMNITNQLTISCWFNSSNIFVAQRLIDKLSGTTTGNFMLDVYNGQLRFFCGSSSITNTLVLNSNAWYHVAATYDGNFMRLYLNGNLLSSAALTGNLTQNLSPFFIGGDQIGGGGFNGRINDVRFYSRVLSPSEISILQTLPENSIVNPSQTLCLGQNTSLVTYASPSNVSFQWKKNGVPMINGGNISGVNSATLNINNISITDYDNYSCDVYSSNCLLVPSNTLTVAQQFNTTVSNNNLAVYYPFSGSASLDLSGNNLNFATYTGIANIADKDNSTNQALSLNGSNSFINTNSSPLMYSSNSNVTFAMWIKPMTNVDQRLVEKYSSYYLDFNSGQIRFILNTGFVYNTGYVPVMNTWQHIAATYDGNAARFYVNGVMTYSFTQPGVVITQNTNQLQLGYASGGNPYRYIGAMDEFKMYTRGLSTQEIYALYKSGSLTQQPVSAFICNSGATTLSTTVVSSNPINYQWYLNGNLLTGQTSPSLTISNVTSNEVGGYVCTFTTQCSINSTDTAMVNLLAPSTISANVTPSVLCTGGGVVTLMGNSSVGSYSWTSQNAGNLGAGQTRTVNTVNSDTYSLTVTSGTCSAQTAVTVSITTCTSIDEYLYEGNISVYPNPASSLLYVNFELLKEGTVIELTDLAGRVLIQDQIEQKVYTLDIRQLSSGIYLVKIKNGQEQNVRKIIKE